LPISRFSKKKRFFSGASKQHRKWGPRAAEGTAHFLSFWNEQPACSSVVFLPLHARLKTKRIHLPALRARSEAGCAAALEMRGILF
jgi:hypothetical protein